jgi:hypothetical protein
MAIVIIYRYTASSSLASRDILSPDLPGCASAGETEAEARANFKEAVALYLRPDWPQASPAATKRQRRAGR